MIEIKHLKEMNFFAKRSTLLEGNQSLGIEAVLLPRPMISAGEGALQLLIKTNDKFSLENHVKFSEKLDKIFGDKSPISFFSEDNLKPAIERDLDIISYIAQCFLQSAIPIETLSEEDSLENQWKIQESRVAAAATLATSKAPTTPLASSVMTHSEAPAKSESKAPAKAKIT